MTTYRQAADESFKLLLNLWNNAQPFYDGPGGGCFWMAGNTFHSAVDYLMATGQPDVYGLCESAITFFEKFAPKTSPDKWVENGIWLDDYGWWGIALTRVCLYKSLQLPESLQQRFATAAKNCWTGMKSGWDSTNPMVPGLPFTGGIWNSNDHTVSLAGRNSVTQEVFWLLSHYLTEAFGSGAGFLDPNANPALLFSEAKQNGVLFNAENQVLERFRGMPNPMPGSAEWSWLGDQGLFLYACYEAQPAAPGMNKQLTSDIIAAVSKGSNAVLSQDLAPDSQFALDYACGKGVFVRYLGYVNDDNHPQPAPRYDDWIMTNANAVWNNRSADGLFHYWWDRKDDNSIYWGGYSTAVVNNVLHASGFNALVACLWPNVRLGNNTIPVASPVAAK